MNTTNSYTCLSKILSTYLCPGDADGVLSKKLINDGAVVYTVGRRQGADGGCRLDRWRPPVRIGQICGEPQPALARKAGEVPLNLWTKHP